MYYFFRPKMVYRKEELISASLINKNVMELRGDWASGRLIQPTSLEFMYSLRGNAPILDNYYPGGLFNIYSEKLISIFRRHEINFELFPVKFFSMDTGDELKMNHSVFRLLDISDCLDDANTTYETVTYVTPNQKIPIKPIYTDEFLKSGKMLTRIKGFEKLVLIHEILKRELEDAQISGCEFFAEKKRLSEIMSLPGAKPTGNSTTTDF